MKEIRCPFCHEVMTKIEPIKVINTYGKYTCYRMICKNKDKHYGNGNIIVPFKKEEE